MDPPKPLKSGVFFHAPRRPENARHGPRTDKTPARGRNASKKPSLAPSRASYSCTREPVEEREREKNARERPNFAINSKTSNHTTETENAPKTTLSPRDVDAMRSDTPADVKTGPARAPFRLCSIICILFDRHRVKLGVVGIRRIRG